MRTWNFIPSLWLFSIFSHPGKTATKVSINGGLTLFLLTIFNSEHVYKSNSHLLWKLKQRENFYHEDEHFWEATKYFEGKFYWKFKQMINWTIELLLSNNREKRSQEVAELHWWIQGSDINVWERVFIQNCEFVCWTAKWKGKTMRKLCKWLCFSRDKRLPQNCCCYLFMRKAFVRKVESADKELELILLRLKASLNLLHKSLFHQNCVAKLFWLASEVKRAKIICRTFTWMHRNVQQRFGMWIATESQ